MIDRAMLKHHIVGINNPLRFAAWAWMLSSARYKAGIYYDAGHEIKLDRGQFVCGRKFMAGETGMTEKQVRVFLAALERSGMCLKTVHPKGQGITIVTICNYDVYQDYDAYKAEQGPRSGPSKGQGRAKQGPHSETPEETPDETKGIKPKTKKPTAKELVFSILSHVASDDAVNGFIEMRWNIKAPMTEYAAKLIAKELHGRMNADDILNLSIKNNWKGIFPDSSQLTQGKHNGQLNGNQKQTGLANDPALEQIARLAKLR